MKNEQGFTLIEGLLSLSLVLVVCVFLFPMMMQMLNHLNEGKKELTAYRLLFEHVDQYVTIDGPITKEIKIRDIHYELMIKEHAGRKRACVEYDQQQKCIE